MPQDVSFPAWKVPIFGIIQVRTFPYSVRMRDSTDQNNSEYERFFTQWLSFDFYPYDPI